MPAHIHVVSREGAGAPTPAAPGQLVSGSAAATTWNAFTGAGGRFHAGHWASEAGVRRVRYDETEFCLILSGRVRLAGRDGAAEFAPGDAFVIEAGFEGTWESVGAVTKLYVVLDPGA